MDEVASSPPATQPGVTQQAACRLGASKSQPKVLSHASILLTNPTLSKQEGSAASALIQVPRQNGQLQFGSLKVAVAYRCSKARRAKSKCLLAAQASAPEC